MKKILVCILMITFLMTLSSCNKVEDSIPLVLYNEEDPFIMEFKSNILKNAEGKLRIESYNSQNSQIIQNEIIEGILEENPKVLIINPVDRLGAYTIIDKVRQYNIPIVFINREPLETDMDSWDQVYYIGAPAENSAIIQAEMIHSIFEDPESLSKYDKNGDNIIQLVLLKGEQGHQDAEIRTEVVMESLEDYGYRTEILSIEICDWKRTIALDKMTTLLKDLDKEIELVISNNDAMALGAIDAMIAQDLFIDDNNDGFIDKESETWVPVVGIDGIETALEYIESGHLYGTVINDSEEMSKALVELVETLQNKEDLGNMTYELMDEKYIWIDYRKFDENEETN